MTETMPLDGLVLFVRAAEAGSFVGAAIGLGLTPSAVSKAVGRLEAKLGIQLFRRTTRALNLTQDGRALFERCRGPLADIEAAQEFLKTRLARPRGLLRVSVPVVFGYRVVAPLLPGFTALHPDVEVEMVSTDQFADLVADRVDVVVRTGRLADAGLVARKLLDTRFMTCASPGYIAEHGEPAAPRQLGRHRCLRFVFPETGRTFAWPFDVGGERIAVPPKGPLAFTNADALIAAAEAGGGLTHMQSYMLAHSVRSGRLIPVLEPFQADGGPISAVWMPNRLLSPTIRAFVEYLAAAAPLFSAMGVLET